MVGKNIRLANPFYGDWDHILSMESSSNEGTSIITGIVSALRQNGWGTQEELHAPPPPTWTPEVGKVGKLISNWNDGRAGKKPPVSADPNVTKHIATWTAFVASQKQPNKPTGPSIAGVVAKLRSNGWGSAKDFKRKAHPIGGGSNTPTPAHVCRNESIDDDDMAEVTTGLSADCEEGRVSVTVTNSPGDSTRSRCSITIDGEEAVILLK